MIDDIRLGWAALRESPPPAVGDLAVREAGPLLAHGAALLGLDDRRRMHLMLPGEADGPEDESLEAVRIRRRPLSIGGVAQEYTDIVCELVAVEEVFDHFAVAVLEAVHARPSEHPGVLAIEVLGAWRRFLVASGRAVTPEGLAPLFAELLVVSDVARFGSGDIAAWRGPGARHDFVRGRCALEVKSSRAHTSREVTIHGIDQLEAPEGADLFLEFVRLEEAVDAGESVPDLVDGILARGASGPAVFAAVERSGLAAADYEEARAIRFVVRERTVVPVRDPFPRLVTASFADGDSPRGIRDIVYRADLDVVLDSRLLPEEVAEVHRALAGGRE